MELIETRIDVAARFVECDISCLADAEAAVREATGPFGSLDCMVNCVGVSHAEQFLEVEVEDHQAVRNVNAKGVFFRSQLTAREMKTHS